MVGDGRTARERLERILHVLPAASRADGAALGDLARTLGASEERILEDLEEVTARAYYHPGGWPDDVQIMIESDRVTVRRADGLDRPVKLSMLETLALALALRGTAASAALADAGAREALLERAESHLVVRWEEEQQEGQRAKQKRAVDNGLRLPDRAPDSEGVRELLIDASRERRACAIHYLKPGAADGSVRLIHPYCVAYAEGHWYTVGHCTVENGVRVFRLDRILAADVSESGFEPPASFLLEDYVKDGRVYRADGDRPLRVRYSPRVARWIRERAEWESAEVDELEDGSVMVEGRAADPWWAVGQALQYGAEAEILEPEEVRALVVQVAEELAGETA